MRVLLTHTHTTHIYASFLSVDFNFSSFFCSRTDEKRWDICSCCCLHPYHRLFKIVVRGIHTCDREDSSVCSARKCPSQLKCTSARPYVFGFVQVCANENIKGYPNIFGMYEFCRHVYIEGFAGCQRARETIYRSNRIKILNNTHTALFRFSMVNFFTVEHTHRHLFVNCMVHSTEALPVARCRRRYIYCYMPIVWRNCVVDNRASDGKTNTLHASCYIFFFFTVTRLGIANRI